MALDLVQLTLTHVLRSSPFDTKSSPPPRESPTIRLLEQRGAARQSGGVRHATPRCLIHRKSRPRHCPYMLARIRPVERPICRENAEQSLCKSANSRGNIPLTEVYRDELSIRGERIDRCAGASRDGDGGPVE